MGRVKCFAYRCNNLERFTVEVEKGTCCEKQFCCPKSQRTIYFNVKSCLQKQLFKKKYGLPDIHFLVQHPFLFLWECVARNKINLYIHIKTCLVREAIINEFREAPSTLNCKTSCNPKILFFVLYCNFIFCFFVFAKYCK